MQPLEDTLSKLRDHFPAALHPRLWVAGGYAVCPEKASDCDVWLLGTEADRPALEEAVRRLWHGVTRDIDSTYSLSGFSMVGQGLLPEQGAMRLWRRRKMVQVLLADAATPEELLGRFDISCHQRAINVATGAAMEALTYTGMFSQPRLTHLRGGPAACMTQQRIGMLCQRYSFEPHPDDLERIRHCFWFETDEQGNWRVMSPQGESCGYFKGRWTHSGTDLAS